MILQACLNGARPAAFHPRLPVHPTAMAEDGVAAIRAGANELHVHIRGPDGGESLAPGAVDATIAAIRARLPGTPVGVSTGSWIEKDDARRTAFIDIWGELPDYASVNLHEADALAVIAHLHRRGIGIEAGLGSAADAERLVATGLGPIVLRVLVEVGAQNIETAMATADEVLAALNRAGIRKPILMHGYEATVWPFVERAARAGFSTRIGLEDTNVLPDGTAAADNAALIAAALDIKARHLS